MAKLHTLQAHGSGRPVSMRNTYTAAMRAADAPGDDPLARALRELNSRALRVCPSAHKFVAILRVLARWGVIVSQNRGLCPCPFFGDCSIITPHLRALAFAIRGHGVRACVEFIGDFGLL
jgi:hypothetical protein